MTEWDNYTPSERAEAEHHTLQESAPDPSVLDGGTGCAAPIGGSAPIENAAAASEQSVKHAMQFIIITGISGAGKALAMRHFEDFGFYCVDNLPPTLLPMFTELCARGATGPPAPPDRH